MEQVTVIDLDGKDFLSSAWTWPRQVGLQALPSLLQPSLFLLLSPYQVQRPLDRLFCSVVTVAEQKYQSTLW